MFSSSVNQFVSTHGFDRNDIVVWDYQNLKKTAVLEGHEYRVMYSTLSSDGCMMCTGSGDETLRFWKIFPRKTELKDKS